MDSDIAHDAYVGATLKGLKRQENWGDGSWAVSHEGDSMTIHNIGGIAHWTAVLAGGVHEAHLVLRLRGDIGQHLKATILQVPSNFLLWDTFSSITTTVFVQK